MDRLSRIHQHIFIDEVQDLAGHDLEVLRMLLSSQVRVLLVGDPRQGVFSTNNSAKHKQLRRSEIVHFFEDDSFIIEKDETSFVVNHRCAPTICDLSNSLFPDFADTTSGNTRTTGHDGIFRIRQADVAEYLRRYRPMQLRDSIRKEVANDFPVMNFGLAKGLTFERVLIYPTGPYIKWLKDRASELAAGSRSKLYVAVTRARQSVTFVHDYIDGDELMGITNFQFMPE